MIGANQAMHGLAATRLQSRQPTMLLVSWAPRGIPMTDASPSQRLGDTCPGKAAAGPAAAGEPTAGAAYSTYVELLYDQEATPKFIALRVDLYLFVFKGKNGVFRAAGISWHDYCRYIRHVRA